MVRSGGEANTEHRQRDGAGLLDLGATGCGADNRDQGPMAGGRRVANNACDVFPGGVAIMRVWSICGVLALLSACAAPPPAEQTVRYGKVVQVESVSLEGDHQLGLGSVIGAVAGGVIGHQFGGGTGRDVATVAGVLAGGVTGSAVQNKYAQRRPGQHVIVKLDNEVSIGITQPTDS